MAYTAPTLRSTGDLITASIYNTDLVNNILAMYAGAMSIASQAAGDIIAATSPTQLGRYNGTGYVRANGSGAPTIVTPALVIAAPSSRTSASSTYKMAGFGSQCAITPTSTGKVGCLIAGSYAYSGTSGHYAYQTMRFGTGSAPAAGDGEIGTACGVESYMQGNQSGDTDNNWTTFVSLGRASGLAVGTPYWFDCELKSNFADNFIVNGLTALLFEQ